MPRDTQNAMNIHEWASHTESGNLARSDPHFFPVSKLLASWCSRSIAAGFIYSTMPEKKKKKKGYQNHTVVEACKMANFPLFYFLESFLHLRWGFSLLYFTKFMWYWVNAWDSWSPELFSIYSSLHPIRDTVLWCCIITLNQR